EHFEFQTDGLLLCNNLVSYASIQFTDHQLSDK
ncbi:MAG: hypothetical protein ACI8XB_002157, partial [Patiriisocius sp.]